MSHPNIRRSIIEDIQETKSEKEVLRLFREFEAQTSLDFIHNLTILIERIPDIIQILYEILENEERTIKDRFAAFYAINIFYRRNKEASKMEQLHQEFGNLFSEKDLYEFSYGVFLTVRGRKHDWENAIRHMRRSIEKVDDNPGLYKGLAFAQISALEEGVMSHKEDEVLRNAEENIKLAIELWPDYAEYYQDLGRIYTLKGEFEKAKEAINTAIDKEKREKENYAIRIADYQYYLSQIRIKEMEDIIDNEINTLKKEISTMEERSNDLIEDFQTIILQSLGFFAGLITIIITSVQIATSFSVTNAVQLLLFLIGGIIFSFGGLSLVLPASTEIRETLVAFASGLILIGIATLIMLL